MADRTIPAFKILRGSVGVGTTLPSSTFHVYSDSSTNTIINLQGGSATNKGAYMNFFRGTTNVGALGTKASLIGGTSNDMMFYSASNDWIFYSTGERMRVQADGLVGIGTNAPAVELHINDASGLSAIRLTGGAAGADNFQIMQGVTGVTNAGLSIYDVDATAIRFVIDSSGNTIIGGTSSFAKLDVRSSVSGKYLYMDDGANAAWDLRAESATTSVIQTPGTGWSSWAVMDLRANYFKFKPNNSEIMRVISTGVGIGTDAPAAPLNVTSAYSASATTTAIKVSTVGGYNATSGVSIDFGNDQGNYATWLTGQIASRKDGGSWKGALTFSTNNDSSATDLVERMRINGDGNVGVGTNNPGYPLQVYYAGGATIGMQVKGTANRARLVVTDNDTSAYVIAEDSHASFGRQDALSANNLNINSDGSVGIGTNAASTFCKLNVKGAVRLGRGSNDLGSYNGDDFDLFVGYGANGSKIMLYDDQAAYHSALIQYGNALLRIGLNNSNSAPTILDASAINIIPAGVGIGIGVFTARLAVKSAGSTTDQIVVVHSGNSVEIAQLGQSANGSSAGTLLLKNNSGTDKIYLDAAGSSYFRGGSITVGLDDTGHDVRLYGATSGRYWEWDESDDLVRQRDGVKTTFGNGTDLMIWHDGSNSYLQQGSNGGNLNFTNSGGSKFSAIMKHADAVELYFNGSKKFETLNTGAKVTGTLQADVLNNAANSANIIYRSGSSTIVGNNASALVVLDTGFVGIGTASTMSSSGELLGVYSASTGHASFKNSSDSFGTVYIRNVSTTANTWQPYLILADSGGNRGGLGLKYSTAGLKVHGQGGIEFWTGGSFGGGTVKMTLSSSGHLTVAPNASELGITIGDASKGEVPLIFKGVSGSHSIGQNGASFFISENNAGNLDNNPRFVIDTNGNCGVGGVTSPTSLLHVAGDLGNSAYIAYIYNSGSQSEDNGLNVQVASSGSSCYALRVNTGGDGTTLVATGSGNVGIGYTPSNITEKFCVNGKTRLQSSGDGNNVLECIDSAGDAMFNIRQSANDCLIRGYKDGGTQTLQFHSDGESYIKGGAGGGTDLSLGGPGVTSHGTLVLNNGGGSAIGKIRAEGSDDSFYVSKLAGGGLFHFTSNNSFQFNQNVKLQTTDHVILDLSTPSGNNYTMLRFSPNGTQASYIRAQTNGDVIFDNSSGTLRMKMSNNGFIQIGNNLPVWSGSYGGALLLKGNNSTSDRYAQLTTVDSSGAVTNTGLVVKNGDVGIGTNAPARALDVDGRVRADTYGFRSDTPLRYYYFDDFGGSNLIGRGGNAYTEIYDAGVQSMVWKGGSVGIGTNNPTQPLVVAKSNSGGVGGSIRIDNLAGAAADKTQLIFSSFGNSYHRAMIQCTVESSAPFGGTLEFYTGISSGTFTEKMRVDHNGAVGIGTNNPSYKLHVTGGPIAAEDGAGTFRLIGTAISAKIIDLKCDIGVFKMRSVNDGREMYHAADSYHKWYISDSEKMQLNSAGNVGIGTDNPTEKLTVLGNASVSGSFSASSKSFLIDHPTKENKKLEHGCLEGPEFGVYHRGRVQSSTITLPDYWSGLVGEETITVQLTPNGSFQHLYVVSQSLTEIVIGAADGETIDCFYTIYGERADIDRLEVEKEV